MSPTQTIPSANNPWQTGASWQTQQEVQQEVVDYVNTSPGIRTAGDVVVLDVSTMANYGQNATTTATVATSKRVLGVVGPKATGSLATNGDTYAVGAVMPVIIKGPARINIGANVVAVDDALSTDGANAGQAAVNAVDIVANAGIGGVIAFAGEASTAKDANNTIRAYVSKS